MTAARQRRPAQDTADTNEIKREIERTRVEMSETLGEIQERLRPDHLIQQAKDTVTEAATGKVRTIMHSAGNTATRVADQTRYAGRSAADYACEHPLQMALLAGGLTWWLLRGRSRSYEWEGASEGWQSDALGAEYDADAPYGGEPSLRDRAGEYVASARDTVNEYASSARETAGDYADAARSGARRASARVRGAASSASTRARETWRRTTTSVDDWAHEYPMAAGAVALAVGAAIGLSVPGTDWEDRTMGDRRDQAMEAARAKARELTETVSERAKNVASTVADITAPAGAAGAAGATGAVDVSGTSTTGRV
jgi:ElaB/YqjD/DUF883 family membrane-anchored ribosome-binding protein